MIYYTPQNLQRCNYKYKKTIYICLGITHNTGQKNHSDNQAQIDYKFFYQVLL